MYDFVSWDFDAISETVDLSDIVFSGSETDFENFYDGTVEDYEQILYLRDRMESASFTPSDMKSFNDLEFDRSHDANGVAEVFYAVPADGVDWITHTSPHLGDAYTRNVIDGLLENDMVEEVEGSFFYGENAFPYLLIFGNVEKLLEEDSPAEPYSRVGNQGEG